ncbi:hypothetical protein K9N68_01265 [Kovacikia minuta CCNUW1]|uniref:hypothetical protein n=1 Tax=Kovacikia minuta TaxID=2931930 RepID=UPI001CCD230B|nr:hypothetical protein [Kovacikia minuta]UBF26670.1 hypothetical protein K9N68_01265 [Kovacikia minuta CCNUW1]
MVLAGNGHNFLAVRRLRSDFFLNRCLAISLGTRLIQDWQNQRFRRNRLLESETQTH